MYSICRLLWASRLQLVQSIVHKITDSTHLIDRLRTAPNDNMTRELLRQVSNIDIWSQQVFSHMMVKGIHL